MFNNLFDRAVKMLQFPTFTVVSGSNFDTVNTLRVKKNKTFKCLIQYFHKFFLQQFKNIKIILLNWTKFSKNTIIFKLFYSYKYSILKVIWFISYLFDKSSLNVKHICNYLSTCYRIFENS